MTGLGVYAATKESVGLDLLSTASSGLKSAAGAFAPKKDGANMAKDQPAAPKTSSESWYQKPLVGPVKWWHALAAVVVGTAGTIAYKKLHK